VAGGLDVAQPQSARGAEVGGGDLVVDEAVEEPVLAPRGGEGVAEGRRERVEDADVGREPDRAAASAASTRAVTCSVETAAPETDPVLTPPSPATNEMTVTEIPVITPLVVSVLLAQRRLALVASRTIAMQSSALEVARACSTSSCGVTVISGLPRRWC
jgi:hypothetical protein